jgi:hypothetical protein
MDLYYTSEELVKLLEQRVQEETNDSFKSQYQILLQQQRNASASLKSLAEARGGNQAQTQQAQAKSQSQVNQQAQQQSQNSQNQEFGTESYVDTSSMTQAQKNATMNQRKETGALDSDQKGSSNK